jgi:peptidyl-prolyl cis-trans isomerase SurA
MMTRSIVFRLAAGLCVLSLSVVARADDLPSNATERVAAVVNDDAITIHDLDARVRLGLLAANLPDTVSERRQIAAEILRRLIDEHLEVQEAARNKITITDGEVASSVGDLEKQNHMEKGQLIELLQSHDIDPQTLRDQVRAQQLWVRVVRQVLLPTVRVGEEEIDARLAQMRDGLNKPAYLAADIYLAVEDPRREPAVRQLADSLVQQVRAGAPFSALARQFSQAGAAAGGDLGWVSPNSNCTRPPTRFAPAMASTFCCSATSTRRESN